eukprot:scaffold2117_cov82-Skeletonema_dohrnii-CCMP3373.AAC.7
MMSFASNNSNQDSNNPGVGIEIVTNLTSSDVTTELPFGADEPEAEVCDNRRRNINSKMIIGGATAAAFLFLIALTTGTVVKSNHMMISNSSVVVNSASAKSDKTKAPFGGKATKAPKSSGSGGCDPTNPTLDCYELVGDGLCKDAQVGAYSGIFSMVKGFSSGVDNGVCGCSVDFGTSVAFPTEDCFPTSVDTDIEGTTLDGSGEIVGSVNVPQAFKCYKLLA